MPDDLLKKPETAYVVIDDKKYKAEQDLADRYRSFVAEILRLSLGGLAVFSFIYKQDTRFPKTLDAITPKDVFALSGVVMFALSAVFALVFLYFASEGLRWYIAGVRHHSFQSEAQTIEQQVVSGKEISDFDYLAERNNWIVLCRWSKVLAALMLGLGGVCMALAIIPFS